MAEIVTEIAQKGASLGKEGLTSGLAIAAGILVSSLLAPILGNITAPLSNWVASVMPSLAYAVAPAVNFAAAVLLAVFVKVPMVQMVAMGMAIYSVLVIIAPLITQAGAMLGGVVAQLGK